MEIGQTKNLQMEKTIRNRHNIAWGAPLLSMSNYLVDLAIYAIIAFMAGVAFFRKKTM